VLTVLFVVVAAGLVVASVLTDSLPLAIAGLVVALVALGLIVWPVLMARRAAAVAAEEREEAAAQPPADPPAAEPAVEAPAAEEPAASEQPAEAAEPVVDEPAAVLVVPGRHRYHRAGCSMLEGREPETLDLDEAREEGFTPCSRCGVGALTRS
jgi:predicted lipid-binding transport protein (Tim44 family)